MEMPNHRHSISVASTAAGSNTTGDKIRYNGTATSYNGTLYTAYTGGGMPHNNMPPYVQVSIWRRTA
jgi:microcystin-dependent protein